MKDQRYNKNFDLSPRNIQEADPNHQKNSKSAEAKTHE